ncbi:mitochondrial import inner membrane translocase subunit TIM50-C [Halyomorpha halys]|uniref:mitochondrial import inner membrane translocase subunit TIM50-C n=1 Tax=Halyomorpha halys TaxID=286706 RepID=UPI0006D52816|nr:mitochondrial import inner membrane translocase subunit TIM50-C [Halyomorpha halys]
MAKRAFDCFRLGTKFCSQISRNSQSLYSSKSFSSISLKKQDVYSKTSPIISRFTSNTPPKAPWMESDLKTPLSEFNKKQQHNDDQKSRDDSWRKMKYSLIAMGTAIGICGGTAAYTLGRPKTDEEGNIVEDEFSKLPVVQQFFKRMFHEIEYYNKMIKEPSRDKLLPDPVKHPYFQPPYTLVLEMTDLLVHPEWTYQTGWRFKKRPGVDKFLEQVSAPNFEIVVYTAEQGLTVFPILDSLDPNGYIMYRLVRDATDFVDGHHVKNLDCLNRDLKKVIVVDWNSSSVKLHPTNAFLIPKWNGNDDDTTLVDLAAFLRTIAANEVEDVRDVLAYYREFENPIEAFRENQRRLLEQMEEREKHNKDRKQNPPLTSRWASSFLNR